MRNWYSGDPSPATTRRMEIELRELDEMLAMHPHRYVVSEKARSMDIARDGEHTSTMQRWIVQSGRKEYSVECSWSRGSQRMEWYVSVLVSRSQEQTHWRGITGREIINAVRIWENRRS